jgi:hypothetical protein
LAIDADMAAGTIGIAYAILADALRALHYPPFPHIRGQRGFFGGPPAAVKGAKVVGAFIEDP